MHFKGNNALERYNRVLNNKFPMPHPALALFVQIIDIEAQSQVQCLNDIRSGRIVPPTLQETTINAIPLCYVRFAVN